MKKIIKISISTFLTIFLSINIYAKSQTKEQDIEISFSYIANTLSLLDQIAAYAYIMADTSDKKIALAAKKELTNAMKKLDTQTYNELYKDYNTMIKNHLHSHTKVVYAFHRLINKIESLKARALLAQTTKDAATTVSTVSDELKPIVIEEQQQKIQEAEKNALQKDLLSNLKTSLLSNEISWAKKAFYAAVGAATIAGLYYGYRNTENIAQTINRYWMNALLRIGQQKGPLQQFLDNLKQLNKIDAMKNNAIKLYEQNPNEKNGTIVEYLEEISFSLHDSIAIQYKQFSPEVKKRIDLILENKF